MEKILEVEFVKVFDKWAWRITYQDEIILKRGRFEDKELNVYSYKGPYYTSYDSLYIRGEDILRDNTILFCDDEEKKIIEGKVNSINAKYSKTKKWRAKWRAKFNEKYYYVEHNIEVQTTKEFECEFDDELYESDNYFKTKEEAQLYADKIKKILSERE